MLPFAKLQVLNFSETTNKLLMKTLKSKGPDIELRGIPRTRHPNQYMQNQFLSSAFGNLDKH